MPRLVLLPDHEDAARRPILIPPRVWDELDSYEKNLQSKFIKAFRLISRNIRYPSLHLEVIKAGREAFFRVHVDPSYRIHFELKDDYYLILAIGPHRLQGIG